MPAPIPCTGISRVILADIYEAHHLTDETVARWCGVDRTLVCQWRDGSRGGMPVWALGKIIQRVGTAGAALRELAGLGTCDVVHRPDAEETSGLGLPSIDVAGASIALARAVAVAQQDGRVDASEAADLHNQITSLQRRLAGLHVAVQASVRKAS